MITRLIKGKINVSATMECLTGLHIGASKDTLSIGGIDLPIIRDPLTNQPYVPGSSLKGKLRCLLEKSLITSLAWSDKQKTRTSKVKKIDIVRHECANADLAKDCPICRVFGSTGYDGGTNFPARLIVRDAELNNADYLNNLLDTGLDYAEWKFENTIDRFTSAANPRQIERVPRGAMFNVHFVYTVETGFENHISIDLGNILKGLELLEGDALGGHGSRGYGQVDFACINVDLARIDTIGISRKLDLPKKDNVKVGISDWISQINSFYAIQ